MQNILGSGHSETVAEFTKRISNGDTVNVKYHNFYSTLKPLERSVLSNKETSKDKRLDFLRTMLADIPE